MKNISTYTTIIVAVSCVIAALALIKILNISYPISVTTRTTSGELAVVGEGKIDVVPDTAYIDAGISVQNSATVESVQKTLTDVNNKIIDAMKGLGIDKADIKTSNFSINPNYQYDRSANTISGYNGSATVTIKAKDPKIASRVIEEATKAGANQVNGTRFVVDDPAKYREQARESAIANAKDQANKLAKSLGISIGKVTNIVESSPNSPLSYPMYATKDAMGAGGGSSPNIEPGTQTVTSTVTLYFEKK
jgi:hypothetical protein